MREQEVRELYEAYLEVYQEQELDEALDKEFASMRKRGGRSAPPDQRSIGGEANRRNKDYWADEGGPNRDRGAGNKAKRRAAELNKEEVETDLFDYILEHLVSEGYADTEEAALAIMANMSEEWRESIVEEVLDEALTGERLQRAQEIIARDPKSPKAKDVKRVAGSQEGSDRNDTTPGDLPRDRSNTTLPTKRGGKGIKGRGKTVNRAPHGAPLGAGTFQSDRGRRARG